MFRKRIIGPTLKKYLENFPMVAITGPRQSGKSTLLRHTLKNYQYVTFDDYTLRDFFSNDPYAFMETYSNNVIFDEAQKEPKLFDFLKIVIDNDRKNYGKFILSGSSQFTLLKKISESLAGRIGLLTLLPFQLQELPVRARKEAVFKGSYPETVMNKYQAHIDWYAYYVDTYLNKDLREILEVGNLNHFKRFLRLLAANTTQELNMSHYANDIGVSVPTIKNWISVLEASYIIFLLPPFYKNYGKRTTKSPKIYFYDTGLISFLTSIKTFEQYEYGPMTGRLFENYVVSGILKKERHGNTHSELFFYRSSGGIEIDLIIDRGEKQEFIEVKHSKTFTSRMTKSIEQMIDQKDSAYVLFNGKNIPYKKNIAVMNYQDYLLQ